MSALVTATLIAVGLIVVALALSLITILLVLRSTLSMLYSIYDHLRTIAQQVEPLDPVLTEVNSDLSRSRDELVGVLRRHGTPPVPARSSSNLPAGNRPVGYQP